jgi:branched-chain amino acid transport system substrate-binding protein
VRFKRLSSIIALGGLAASIAACGSAGSSGGTGAAGSDGGKTYTIGAAIPLSGANASTGKLVEQAYNAAANYVNSAGLISGGGKIKMAYADDQCLPSPAVTAVHQLVEVDSAAVLGVLCSNAIAAVQPYTDQNKIFTINTSGTSPQMAGIGKYVVSLTPLLDGELPTLLDYAAKTLHLKRVAVIYTDETLGQTANKAIQQIAPSLGMTVTASVSIAPLTSSDFSSQVAEIKASNPDAVYVAMLGADQSNGFMTALRQAGVTATALSYDGVGQPSTFDLPAAQGMYYAQQSVNYAATDPVTAGFVKAYKQLYKSDPWPGSGQIADAVILSAQLINTLNKQGKPITGPNLMALVKSAKSFNLVGGKVAFQFPANDLVTPIDLLKISGQQPVKVATVAIPAVSADERAAGF